MASDARKQTPENKQSITFYTERPIDGQTNLPTYFDETRTRLKRIELDLV